MARRRHPDEADRLRGAADGDGPLMDSLEGCDLTFPRKWRIGRLVRKAARKSGCYHLPATFTFQLKRPKSEEMAFSTRTVDEEDYRQVRAFLQPFFNRNALTCTRLDLEYTGNEALGFPLGSYSVVKATVTVRMK